MKKGKNKITPLNLDISSDAPEIMELPQQHMIIVHFQLIIKAMWRVCATTN
jgi:hypothetical protein